MLAVPFMAWLPVLSSPHGALQCGAFLLVMIKETGTSCQQKWLPTSVRITCGIIHTLEGEQVWSINLRYPLNAYSQTSTCSKGVKAPAAGSLEDMLLLAAEEVGANACA